VPQNLPEDPTLALITTATATSSLAWIIPRHLSWNPYFYALTAPSPQRLRVARVRNGTAGDAVAYLTHVVAYYGQLPDILLFLRPERLGVWNSHPSGDGEGIFRRLDLERVWRDGYSGLKCGGCSGGGKEARRVLQENWGVLFPGETRPEMGVQGTGGGQFAVTGQAVRRRSRASYERIRDWVVGTEERDDVVGEVMELLWHVLFKGVPEGVGKL
jgi:hypothetical protein